MKLKKAILLIFYLASLVTGVLLMQGCRTYSFRNNYQDANKLLHETRDIQTKPFLKAHLKNGGICILRDTWEVDSNQVMLSGNGILYDYNRNRISEGQISIPIDSVAIFETNQKIDIHRSARIAALSIIAAADVVLGIICITNPKACFGSCPSFYINETSNIHYADAEGFSNAISPSLECFDIDALNNRPATGIVFSITMKNEALETHCVNDVKLLACPRTGDNRIYQTPANDFYLCENKYQLNLAVGPEGDITALLNNDDSEERFSLAGENNLSSKEEIYLDFDNVFNTDNLGLVISFRQTLMTTYFIYSAIGYMGDEVGDLFAEIETSSQTNDKLTNGIKKELGNIDVYVWNENIDSWEMQGGFYEIGPIAFNHQVLPVRNTPVDHNIKMKLVLNRGLWCIDYLALTNINHKVKPVEIAPTEIYNKGVIDSNALVNISLPGRYLLSMPGDEYKFNFILPEENRDWELFLYTKGYYLEWMRERWIKDKDLLKLKQMIENPKKYLKEEAKAYKLYETTMTREFWNSKIDTKTFSYDEN